MSLGYFATMPPYQYSDPSQAIIKVSLNHATDRIEPCVPLTPEQIAELAANMRRAEACGRARLPLFLQLDIDGHTVLDLTAYPSGLWNDGPASVYEKVAMRAGQHTIAVRLRDTSKTADWNYASTVTTDLRSGRYYTITFRPEAGGFVFR